MNSTHRRTGRNGVALADLTGAPRAVAAKFLRRSAALTVVVLAGALAVAAPASAVGAEKSDKSWRGCRDLVLKFHDGTTSTSRFNLR